MTTLVSKRHKTKFYLTITLGCIFFAAMGSAVAYDLFTKLSGGDINFGTPFILFLCAGTYFMAFYGIYRYYKNAPEIRISGTTISFGAESYRLTDIEEFKLTGKAPFRYVIQFPMEAATLRFRDGQTKYIFDDMYQNSWLLKSFLSQVIVSRKSFIEPETVVVQKTKPFDDCYETFKGNPFFTFRSGGVWMFIVFWAFILFSAPKPPTWFWYFAALYFAFIFFFTSRLMHYIKLSQKYLLIKNHYLPWRNRAYRNEQIREVVFESHDKMPNCIRIITIDFRSKRYPACTLSDKTWIELKEKLESYGVTVRNECIYIPAADA